MSQHAPKSDEDQGGEQLESKEKAKRTYARSVTATKDVINSVRMGQSANIKKIKRVVKPELQRGLLAPVRPNRMNTAPRSTARSRSRHAMR